MSEWPTSSIASIPWAHFKNEAEPNLAFMSGFVFFRDLYCQESESDALIWGGGLAKISVLCFDQALIRSHLAFLRFSQSWLISFMLASRFGVFDAR